MRACEFKSHPAHHLGAHPFNENLVCYMNRVVMCGVRLGGESCDLSGGVPKRLKGSVLKTERSVMSRRVGSNPTASARSEAE